MREKYNDIQKETKTDSISVDKNITKDITNRTLRHQQYSIISLILRISITWHSGGLCQFFIVNSKGWTSRAFRLMIL